MHFFHSFVYFIKVFCTFAYRKIILYESIPIIKWDS